MSWDLNANDRPVDVSNVTSGPLLAKLFEDCPYKNTTDTIV
jgi:hypothetical protein